MGLPSVGPLELIIVLAIALLIVGPKRLPEMGSAVGKTIREFRKTASAVTDPLAEPEPSTSADQASTDGAPAAAVGNTATTGGTAATMPAAADDESDAAKQA